MLFLSQHNSARSIFREALTNAVPDSHLQAFSAGSDPADVIRPQTRAVLASLSIPAAALYPVTSLPLASLDRMRLKQDVTAIGQLGEQSAQEPSDA